MIRRIWAGLVALLLVGFLSACGGADAPDLDTAKMPASADGFAKQGYQKVVADLIEAGFTNVEAEGLEDMVIGLFAKEDQVKEVTVNGYTDYKRGDEFPKDSIIVVHYHSYPEKAEAPEADETDVDDAEERTPEGADLDESDDSEAPDDVDEDESDESYESLAEAVRERWLEIFGIEKEMDLMDAYLEDPYAPTFAITEWEDVTSGWIRIHIQLDISDEEAMNSGKQILGLTCEEFPELSGVAVQGVDGNERNVNRHDMPLCEISDRG